MKLFESRVASKALACVAGEKPGEREGKRRLPTSPLTFASQAWDLRAPLFTRLILKGKSTVQERSHLRIGSLPTVARLHVLVFYYFAFSFFFFLSSVVSPCIAWRARGSLMSNPSLCASIICSLDFSFSSLLFALVSRILVLYSSMICGIFAMFSAIFLRL